MCDAHEDLAVLDLAGCFGFDDLAALAAFEDCEFDHDGGGVDEVG